MGSGPTGALVDVAESGHLRIVGRPFAEREAPLWLVEAGGQLGVLRYLDPQALAPAGFDDLLSDRRWVHELLARLAATGFPSPAPIGAFDGDSLVVDGDGGVWELVSFIDGDEVGWSAAPGMEDVGVLLGRFHEAVGQLPLPEQRPMALPVELVPGVLQGQYGELAQELESALDEIAHEQRPRAVIHGDFTNHNVIAGGDPPRPVGVIDFGLAHVGTPVADIGFGLWRSGRPHQRAPFIDVDRAAALLAGYATVRPLAADDLAAVPTYIFARGLQMAAKRVRAGQASGLVLDQVMWLRRHRAQLAGKLAGPAAR